MYVGMAVASDIHLIPTNYYDRLTPTGHATVLLCSILRLFVASTEQSFMYCSSQFWWVFLLRPGSIILPSVSSTPHPAVCPRLEDGVVQIPNHGDFKRVAFQMAFLRRPDHQGLLLWDPCTFVTLQ